MSQLKDKAKAGLIWNTVERVVSNGMQFLITVILARLLSPDAYGIIAMPAIFLALAQVLVDSGFANAIIRKPDLEEKDLSTAFYFNMLVGIVSYTLLFLSSPIIADYFNTPILSNLLKITALVVFINSLGVVQQAILTKKMDFKTQAIISSISTFISGVLGIWLAFNGYGVWSLVFQQVSAASIRVLLLWVFGHWHPIKVWSSDSFMYLWYFGSKVVIIGFLDTIYNNIYSFVIGKMYNAKDLGNYTRAQQFADLPVYNLSGIIQRVTLPLLSQIQNDNERLSLIYLKIIRLTALLIIPLMIGLAAIASPLIILLLGKEWIGCVLLFQILCIARIWTPFNSINVNLLQVKGRTDLQLKIEIAKKIMITIVLTCTVFGGVVLLMCGFALCTLLAFFINTYYTKRIIGVSFLKQIRAIYPSLLISFIMTFSILFINMCIEDLFIKLIIDILFGTLIYLFFSYIFEKDSLKELMSLMIKKK